MVIETSSIIQDLQKHANEETLEFISEIPEAFNCPLILATITRWRDIRDYFNKPIRVYLVCHNPIVEKYTARVISGYENMYVTFIPPKRKEMLELD